MFREPEQAETCERCSRPSECGVWGHRLCSGCFAEWHAQAAKLPSDELATDQNGRQVPLGPSAKALQVLTDEYVRTRAAA